MSGVRYQHTQDGQEVQEADFNLFSEVAAKSEDWVIAEMLRLAPLNGTTAAKAILPFGYSGLVASNTATVQPNGATGSVLLMPFRVAVGSRTALGSVTTDPAAETTTQLAWHDVRSAVYAISDNSTTFGHAVALAANASGNPRWDLVYVTMSVDANAAAVTRFVKAPGASVGVGTSLVTQLVQTLTINVLAGTAAASPTIPAIPADNIGAGTINVPIAAVQVPNGWGGASTATTQQIAMVAPIVALSTSTGATSLVPCTGNSTITTALAQAWGAATATRPQAVIPPTLAGSTSRILILDQGITSVTFADATIVDNSIDWRRRYFKTFFTADLGDFSSKHTPAITNNVPSSRQAIESSGTPFAKAIIQAGQSFNADDNNLIGITTRSGAVVCYAPASAISGQTGPLALYVDLTTGALKLYLGTVGGTPLRWFFWIDATAQFDNV